MIKFKQSPINIIEEDTIPINRQLQFYYEQESFEVTNTGLNISLKPVTNNNYILKNNHKFNLTEIHFHRPSEHSVNSQGFDMEVHLVHTGVGENLVYSVLLNICDDGFDFGSPFTNIDSQISFDLNHLVPTSCWDYHGSLTTSPFNEVVIWLINQEQMTINSNQAKLINNFYPNNNRCLQPLNDRKVYTVCMCEH